MGLSWFPVAWADLNDGLVAYYPFDGDANDASGNGNDGTVKGATLTEDRFGNPNNAYGFDGSNDCIIVKDFPDLHALTISVFHLVKGLNQVYNNILAFEIPNDELLFYFLSGDSTLMLESHNDGGSPITTLPPPPMENFVHLVFVNDPSNNQQRFFIDNILVKTISHASDYNTGDKLQIGCENGNEYSFNGKIDDIRIYNRALSESEVQQLYQIGQTLQFSKAKYKVGEGDGTTTITVTRTGSNGAISVDYTTSDDSATAPDDYTQTSGTLNWNDGDDADKTFTIDIIDDSAQESNERFIVSLGNPTGGAQLGSPDTAEVTIIDNDSAFSCKKVSEIPKNECNALVALYDSTKGQNWENNSGWKVTNSPCSWIGVSCLGGHVTELSLVNNNLKGSISKKFFKLKQLKKLDLSDNDIDRSILKYVNKFKKLNSLLLNNCLK
jgi:hypothetical protein